MKERWLAWSCIKLLCLTSIALIGRDCVAQNPQIYTSVEADYQGVVQAGTSGFLDDTQVGTAGGAPLFSDIRTFLNPNDPSNPDAEPDTFLTYGIEGIDARARAQSPGTIGVYAAAGGAGDVDGGNGGGMNATATAIQTSSWMIANDNAGTSSLDLNMLVDGLLYRYHRSQIDSTAGVNAKISINQGGEIIELIEANAFLRTGDNPFEVVTDFELLDVDADKTLWDASFTDMSDSDETIYSQFFNETYANLYSVNNNEVFTILTELTAYSNVVGPFELATTSDYYNTGAIGIGTTTSGSTVIDLNPVPEPSGLLCTILIGVAVISKRRRK